ncbi:TPA: hypothetical protein KLD42_002937 [Legionella pneumophila]|nr:hypothetical protein [Legionella pneumophila]
MVASVARMEWNEIRGVRNPISRITAVPASGLRWLCKGFDQRTVTRVLLQAGWLKSASDGKASHKPRIKGVGTPRLYVFTGKIWGGE